MIGLVYDGLFRIEVKRENREPERFSLTASEILEMEKAVDAIIRSDVFWISKIQQSGFSQN